MDKKTLTLVENYSKSLVDVAVEHHLIPEVRQDLTALLEIFQATDLATTLSHEGLSQTEKAALVSQLQAGSHVFVNNFLEVIKQNERESLLETILSSALEKLSLISNEFPLEIQVSDSLSDAQKDRLKAAAEKKFDISVGQVDEVINPELIGGFILKANNKIIDTSIKSQLQQLKMNLK
ncbi:F0F1 ATP synthase subunit delta [Streptococcus pluranimalium]|uniref:F0F1 ATP synthase subunit delta n=1 Tax=Streptococcus pluranimalium TaxID=82348 RepID=UPI001C4D625C|nr:F0F1 ATP synthase subunit delta [Streptococcus pluranimalium]WFM79166.1 F0F1 ATP synthase subunit delta [Streptococcus pluranimalium]